jgi:hypothetical protein
MAHAVKSWLFRAALSAWMAIAPLAALAQPPQPAYVSGNLTTGGLVKGAANRVVQSGNLSGDCTTSGSLAVICLKTNGVSFAASATTDATNAANITSGVLGSSRGGAGSVSGILKANGSGVVSAAASGTDYQAPLTLTTTGTSGPATLSGSTLNVPQYSAAGGGAMSGPTSQTVSGVTSITFTVSPGYDYRIVCTGFGMASGTNDIIVQVGTGSPVTWDTSNDYFWVIFGSSSGSGGPVNGMRLSQSVTSGRSDTLVIESFGAYSAAGDMLFTGVFPFGIHTMNGLYFPPVTVTGIRIVNSGNVNMSATCKQWSISI